MGLVIRKQVTSPDYGQVPGTQFPYEHQFDEQVRYTLVIADDPDAPDYRTPVKPEPAKAAARGGPGSRA